jgi:type III pantothenate kinase
MLAASPVPPSPAPDDAPVLVLHVGHAAVHLGVFAGARLTHRCQLRLDDALQPGVIARRFLGAAPQRFTRSCLCSVSADLGSRVADLVAEATGSPPTELTVESDHGIGIGYRTHTEFSPVRIAAALGARAIVPHENAIVVECGTCTTLTAVDRDGRVPGGVILHGLALWPALAGKAARVAAVTGRFRRHCLGRSANEALAGGAYHGYVGALREITSRLRREAFADGTCQVLATGSDASLFRSAGLFSRCEPRLILIGLREFARRTGKKADDDRRPKPIA